mmetsp:Transcript_4016/g.18265  ORF Transcript_4016/g.18265 Transcript_4016/m.18265 type:complete len:265 (-) Transcript_4016:534-1328(-)
MRSRALRPRRLRVGDRGMVPERQRRGDPAAVDRPQRAQEPRCARVQGRTTAKKRGGRRLEHVRVRGDAIPARNVRLRERSERGNRPFRRLPPSPLLLPETGNLPGVSPAILPAPRRQRPGHGPGPTPGGGLYRVPRRRVRIHGVERSPRDFTDADAARDRYQPRQRTAGSRGTRQGYHRRRTAVVVYIRGVFLLGECRALAARVEDAPRESPREGRVREERIRQRRVRLRRHRRHAPGHAHARRAPGAPQQRGARGHTALPRSC